MNKQLNIIIALIIVLIPLTSFAQDFSWIENAPDRYIASNTKIIISRESPCNQGEEAFMDFIPKWRTNKAFRNSRVRFNDDMSKSSFEFLDNFNLFKASPMKRKGGWISYTTWFGISKDQVCVKFSESCDDETCDGGSDIMARFQRIGGKWYLTDLFLAG